MRPLLDKDWHEAIDAVCALAATPERWCEGRQLFETLRQQGMESKSNVDDLSDIALRLAEESAKGIANAGGVSPAFDVTAPIRVVECVRILLALQGVMPTSDDWQRVEDALMQVPND